MYLDISRSGIVIDTISDSLRTLVSFWRNPNETVFSTAFPSKWQNSDSPKLRIDGRFEIRENASRSGADATIKKFISRARIRAQWQIYRFQPSPSCSTERILRASRAPTTRTEPERTSNRTSTVYANLFVSFPLRSYPILRSLSLSPPVFARHRILTLLPLDRLPLYVVI